jgi:PAS domain S-box-containing protein
LGETEQIIKAILSASLESTLLIDIEGTILAINEICAHRFGKTVSELVGSCLYDLFSPEVARSRKQRIQEAILTKKQIRFQDTRNKRVFNNSIYPIVDAQGKTNFVTVYARDVTEQRRGEEALRKSEEGFRNLAEMLPQAVFEIDLEGNLTFCNAIGLEFFRYTQEDFDKGLNVLNMFVSEERSRLLENIQRKLRGEKLGEEGRYYTALRNDGTIFPVYIYTSPITHKNKPVGLRGLLIDDTERKEAEIALQESESRTRAILNASPDLIFRFSYDGRHLSYSGPADSLYTFPEAFLGKKVSEVLPKEVAEIAMHYIKKTLETRELQVYDYELAIGNELRTFEGRMVPFGENGDKKPTEVLLTARDITDRKLGEEALRNSKEKYRALSKLQEAILKTSFEAFAVIDFKGNILFVDETMTKLSGYSDEEMLNQNFHISNITVGTEFAAHVIESARQKQRIIDLETSLIPKNAAPVPVELSAALIEEEEERVLISFRDLRTEKELSEEISLFRRFTYDFTYASLFKMTQRGPEAVLTEPLPFGEDETDVLINMAIYYTTALGQGMAHSTGLYGPLPVPKASNLVSLVYSFSITDPTYTDPRAKGKTFAFIVLSIPESLIQLFGNRAAIQKAFDEELAKAVIIQDIDLEFLKMLKKRILLH